MTDPSDKIVLVRKLTQQLYLWFFDSNSVDHGMSVTGVSSRIFSLGHLPVLSKSV